MYDMPLMKNTSSGGLQVVVALSFFLTTCIAGLCLYIIAPSTPLIPGAFGCLVIGMIVSGILGRVMAKKEKAEHNELHREYREDREAEKQKKIEEMRAKNSNVPEVKRQMFATKNNDE